MVMLKSFLLAGLAGMVAAKSAVLDLIPGNFDDVVLKSGKPTLVEFFAPWCGRTYSSSSHPAPSRRSRGPCPVANFLCYLFPFGWHDTTKAINFQKLTGPTFL